MDHTKKQLLSIVALLIFIALLLFFGFNSRQQTDVGEDYVAEEAVIIEDTVATLGSLQVPPGFPAQIPVETENLLEGFKVTYLERQLVEFSLKYESSLTPENKWSEYMEYMTSAGYEIDDTGVSNGRLTGANGSNSLLVGIALEGGRTIVRLKYYQR